MLKVKRIEWIDYAKAIGITCVMLSHALIGEPYNTIFRLWFIPIFFFLAGWFAHRERYASIPTLIRHKTLRLLIPYLLINILTYPFWLLVARHYGADAGSDTLWWQPLVGIVRGEHPYLEHNQPLWFLPALMTTEIVYYLIYRAITYRRLYMAITGVTIVIGWALSWLHVGPLPWGLGIVMPMMLFYAGGAWCSTIRWHRLNDWRLYTAMILLGIAGMCIGYYGNDIPIRVSDNLYGHYPAFLIGAIGGVSAIIGISNMLEKGQTYMGWLSTIGRHSLFLLGLHLMTYTLIKGALVYIGGVNLQWFGSLAGSIALCLLTLAVLVPTAEAIQRIRKRGTLKDEES